MQPRLSVEGRRPLLVSSMNVHALACPCSGYARTLTRFEALLVTHVGQDAEAAHFYGHFPWSEA